MSLGTAAAASSSAALTVSTEPSALSSVSVFDSTSTSSLPPASHVSPTATSRPAAPAAAAATSARAEATDLTLSPDVDAALAPSAAFALTLWVPAPLSTTDAYFAKKAAEQIRATGCTSLSLSAAAQSAVSLHLPPPFVPAPLRVASSPVVVMSEFAPPAAAPAAAVAPGSNVDIAPPALALALPSSGPPPLSAQAQYYLTAFCESDTVLQACAAAKQSYLNVNRDLQTHKVQLERFIAKCRRDGAPTVTLPGHLRLNIVKSARLDAPQDSPAFSKEALDALIALENATSKSAFEILCSQKRKMIAHLEDRSTAASHIALNKALCVKEIMDYAARVEKAVRPASREVAAAATSLFTFPVAAAIEFVGQRLMFTINACVLAQIDADMKADQKKAAARIAEYAAEEEVLSGAHNGKTITKIAVREVERRLAPIKKSVERMQEGRAASMDPHTPPKHSTSSSQLFSSKPPVHHRQPASLRSPQNVRAQSSTHPPVFTFAPELFASSTPRPTAARSEFQNKNSIRKRRRSDSTVDETEDADCDASVSLASSSRDGRWTTHQSSNSRGGPPAARSPPQTRRLRGGARNESHVHAMEQ